MRSKAPCGRAIITDHSNIRVFIHQTPQYAHLTVKVLRPYITNLRLGNRLRTRPSIQTDTLGYPGTNIDIDTATGTTNESSWDVPTGDGGVTADETEEVLLLLEMVLLGLSLLLDLLLELLITALDGSSSSSLGLSVIDLLLLVSVGVSYGMKAVPRDGKRRGKGGFG